jgi:hypothetical protein
MKLYEGKSRQAQDLNRRQEKIISAKLGYLHVALLQLRAKELGVSTSKAAQLIIEDTLKIA